MDETARLLDLGDYPNIECSQLADCYVIGNRVRYVMADWFRINGLFRLKVVGTLTRPLAGLEEDQRLAAQAIRSIKAPGSRMMELSMH